MQAIACLTLDNTSSAAEGHGPLGIMGRRAVPRVIHQTIKSAGLSIVEESPKEHEHIPTFPIETV